MSGTDGMGEYLQQWLQNNEHCLLFAFILQFWPIDINILTKLNIQNV